MLLSILFYAAANHLFTNGVFLLLLIYLAFEIGNTMFSSNKDMEGALELAGGILFIGIVLYFLGLRLPTINLTAFFEQPLMHEVFQRGSILLFMPIGIDLFIILILKILSPQKQ